MSEPRKRRSWPIITLVAFFVLSAYAGSYYAMVTPRFTVFAAQGQKSEVYLSPDYGYGWQIEWVFAPMNWIDHLIRPDFWKPPDTKEELQRFLREHP